MNTIKNSSYTIVEEVACSYNDRPELYIMLVRINDRYGVEINNRTSLVGRIMCKNRLLAEARHIQIERSVKKYCSYAGAISMLNIAFAMPSLKECTFIINHINTRVDFNTLCKIKRVYGYKTHPLVEDIIFEDKSYNLSIEITFPGSDFPLGKFIAPDVDSKFSFEINPAFLNL